jgi:hypothetical protein
MPLNLSKICACARPFQCRQHNSYPREFSASDNPLLSGAIPALAWALLDPIYDSVTSSREISDEKYIGHITVIAIEFYRH